MHILGRKITAESRALIKEEVQSGEIEVATVVGRRKDIEMEMKTSFYPKVEATDVPLGTN